MNIREILDLMEDIEDTEPQVGDVVEMECGDTLIETTIAEVTEDGVVLHLDETGVRILVDGAQSLLEGKTGPGLWANIHARRKSGKRMRKKGEEGAPTEKALKSARAGSKNESVTEDQVPEIDSQATFNYAMKMVKALNEYFGGNYFDHRLNKDRSITIIKKAPWAEEMYRRIGKDPRELDGHGYDYALTGKNFDKVITPWYDSFREKGWRFDQPVAGNFGIAVYKQQDVAEAWGAGLGGGEPLFKQKQVAPTRSVMKVEKLLQDFNPEAYSKIVVSFTESTPTELIQKYFRSLGSSLKIQTVNYRDYDPKQIEVTDPSLYEPVLQIYLKFLKDTGQDTIFNSVYTVPTKGSQEVGEAKYQGREVPLGKPMAGDVAKRKVYVRGPKGNVVKVNFGQKGVKIKKNNPGRRKNFRARHNCDNPGPRWRARYWSCRAW